MKPPTILDVAREAGVSYSTVSRTLNGFEFVKASTRQKVLKAARELGYVPNQQARILKGGRSNLIGVLVPTLTNSYVGEILCGIDEELAQSNYNLILYSTNRRQGKESAYVATMMNGGADGLLLVVPTISTPYLEALRQSDFPYVLIDQWDNAEQSFSVNTTSWQGAYDAAQYLVELGHSRIGFISGLETLPNSTIRLDGFCAALSKHDIPMPEEYIVKGDFKISVGYSAAQQLLALETPPTAIFGSNDLSALGAMEAIREMGLRIPEDISIIGFDDIPQASLAYPKLTTVHQPLVQMGRDGALLMLDYLTHPNQECRQITLPTHLVIRDSCAYLNR